MHWIVVALNIVPISVRVPCSGLGSDPQRLRLSSFEVHGHTSERRYIGYIRYRFAIDE
jgi:hypothetical protein